MRVSQFQIATVLGLAAIAVAQEVSLPVEPTTCIDGGSDCATVSMTMTTSSDGAGATHDHSDHEDDDHETMDHETMEHTDEAGTGSLSPSPTESVGCEPHGDHWHCEGPAETGTATEDTEAEETTDADGDAEEAEEDEEEEANTQEGGAGGLTITGVWMSMVAVGVAVTGLI